MAARTKPSIPNTGMKYTFLMFQYFEISEETFKSLPNPTFKITNAPKMNNVPQVLFAVIFGTIINNTSPIKINSAI